MNDQELLTNLSVEELEALAEARLAPVAQTHLDSLLTRHADKALSVEERVELDRLLQQTDQLTILKTRARWTLSRLPVAAASE